MLALDLMPVDRLNCQSKARFSSMPRATRSESSCVAPFCYRYRESTRAGSRSYQWLSAIPFATEVFPRRSRAIDLCINNAIGV